MKTLSALIAFFVLFILLSACNVNAPGAAESVSLEPQATNWQQLGGVAGIGEPPALASNGNSKAIALIENGYLRVKSWNATTGTWSNVGDVLVNSYNLFFPTFDLAMDSSGNPIVAYADLHTDGYSVNLWVKRWNGSSWVTVGPNGPRHNYLGGFRNISLASDNSGKLWVSYVPTYGIMHVIYFDGGDWLRLDDVQENTLIENHSIAVSSSGNPVVAYHVCENNYRGCYNSSIYVKRWTGSAWVQYAPQALDINVAWDAYRPSLALDSSGRPVVAWYEEVGGNSLNVYVKRWNGVAWVQYGSGGPLDIVPFNTAYAPSLALDANNNPTVSWTEYDTSTSTYNTYVKQWTGSTWALVGSNPLSSTTRHANYSSLSLKGGKLVVAWAEGVNTSASNSDNIYVKEYLNNAWLDMGGSLDHVTGQNAVNSSVARKTNNLPVVAWEETDASNGSRNVYVKSWTGASWSLLGGALDRTLTNAANYPSLALRSNQPVVAFQEAQNIYVRRWNGTAWVNVSNNALDTTLSNPAATPSLAIGTDNLPVVAYAENSSIFVKKANGVVPSSVWNSPFGTTALDINASNIAEQPSLALKSDNNPIVAWAEASPSFNVRVKEWNGSSWVALGGSLNISNSNNAVDITVAVRSDNRPVVAWQEAGNIYVKRWDGSSWISVGSMLDMVPANLAVNPILDLRSDDNPVVAWSEGTNTNRNIYVKRWTGTNWVAIGSALDKSIPQNAANPSLVLKSNNNPIVSWEEVDGSSNNIYVRQY